MVEHDLHVLVREAQIEQRHGSFCLCVALLIVEHLQVAFNVSDVHLLEVNLGTLFLS